MSNPLLDMAPSAVSSSLTGLKGAELLSFFISLHWEPTLREHLATLEISALKTLLTEAVAGLREDIQDAVVIPVGETEPSDFIEELRTVYTSFSRNNRSAADIVGDSSRAWSAREDDASGSNKVAFALDIEFVKENPYKASLPICKASESIGLKCEELPTRSRNHLSFYTPKIRPAQAVKTLLSFWEGCVPSKTLRGFLGRYFGDEAEGRRLRFKEHWTLERLNELEAG